MNATLTVSLKAIADNYKLLAKKSAPAECAVVVKADAYGLGLQPVARALWKAGARFFYVALLEEAIMLRGILPKAEIAVLNGLTPKEIKEQQQYKLIPVMNHLGNLAGILHVDTGMNRLGFSVEQAEKLQGLPIHSVMSHLACADTPEHPTNDRQYRAFNRVRKLFPDAHASLAASSGIFLKKCFHFDQVRPGCALYGVNPTPFTRNPMQPVVTLTAPILQIRDITENGTVGYGGTAPVTKGMRLATIALGYADGYLRALSNNSNVVIGGKKVPVLGRVSMDLLVVDISNLPPANYMEAELMGKSITVDDIAQAAGTIGYEVLTRLGNRFKLKYV